VECSPQRGSHPPKISPRRKPYRIAAAVALIPFTVTAETATSHPIPMMLRSAEADPHVTAPRFARCRSTALIGAKPTPRPVSLAAPSAPPARHPRVTRKSAPWPKPPGHATGSTPPASEWVPGLIECQAEQPIPGPCSVDESVVPRRRCQRYDTRSFHGLCSPPRSNALRSDPTVPGRRETAERRAEAQR